MQQRAKKSHLKGGFDIQANVNVYSGRDEASMVSASGWPLPCVAP